MGKHFAPTWGMVMDHKKGIITDGQYIEKYLAILDDVPIHVWDWFFSAETRTLVCFCPEGAFCHRNILVNYLKQIFGDRIIDGGFKQTIT